MWEFHSAHSLGLETYRVTTKSHLGRQGLWLTVEVGALTEGGPRKILLIFVFHFVVRGILFIFNLFYV